MLAFMPWCKINRHYVVDPIEIFPFERHGVVADIDAGSQCSVNSIMRSYKTIEGRPVHRAALVRYRDKSPTEELAEEERETLYELMSLACFSGLSAREYFSTPGAYCNTDCFTLYVQRFGDFTALVTRRREGRTMSAWPLDDISITIPLHCDAVSEVSVDGALLESLIRYRTQAETGEWARWQNATSCFNQANTDGNNISYRVEWVLLTSAFEHLLNARADYDDVATKFSAALPVGESVLARDARRRLATWRDHGQPLRHEWMREFYRIRGDFAHGRLTTRQPSVWNEQEHLVLATIAFPLIVKWLLSSAGVYQLTDDDQAQIDSFESFADTTDFLRPPPDQQNSMDSHWSRVRSEIGRKQIVRRAVENFEAMRSARHESEGRPDAEQSEGEE
jgi:hypothetical protein